MVYTESNESRAEKSSKDRVYDGFRVLLNRIRKQATKAVDCKLKLTFCDEHGTFGPSPLSPDRVVGVIGTVEIGFWDFLLSMFRRIPMVSDGKVVEAFYRFGDGNPNIKIHIFPMGASMEKFIKEEAKKYHEKISRMGFSDVNVSVES